MKKKEIIKFIVSACLAGEKCRYDGNSNTSDIIQNMVKNGSAVAICPELLGGLTTPRVKCELKINQDGKKAIIGEDGKDYSDNFSNGAVISLQVARQNRIEYAILKSKSPSCGYGLVYDGTFSGKLIKGNGITAELFMKSGIKVFTETEIDEFQKLL